MTISAECPHCHKRYNAPATLAGKRVKCKHCGQVFALPASAQESAPDVAGVDLSALESLAADPSQPPQGLPKAPERKPLRRASVDQEAPAELGHPSHGYAKKVARGEAVTALEVSGDSGFLARRPSVPFDFPGARELDSFTPVVLSVLALGWLALTCMQSNDTGQQWVGFLRLGLSLGLFLVLAFPIGLWAVNSAARRCRFVLPPGSRGRTFAIFVLPFAMAIVFWLSGRSMEMLMLGGLLGALILCGACWFLLRLQPQEIATACGTTTAAFAASVLLCYLVMAGVNMGFAAVAQRAQTNKLSSSPVGPTFAWNVPLKEKPAEPATRESEEKVSNEPAPDTKPELAPKASPAQTMQGESPSTTAQAAPVTPEATAKPPSPPQPQADTPPDQPMTTPAADTKPSPSSVKQPAIHPSPLVASVAPVEGLDGCEALIHGSGQSTFTLAIRTRGEQDSVELWSLNPPEKKAQAQFAHEKEAVHPYVLSSSGDWVARTSTWPRKAIAIYSFSAGKDVKVAPFEAAALLPSLVSFLPADVLILNLMQAMPPGFEVVNFKTNPVQQITFLEVAALEESSGNPSISPDGRFLAVTAPPSETGKGNLAVYDFIPNHRRPSRLLPVPLSPWVTPAGMAFSPDGRQIAAFFEQQGRGLLVSYRLLDNKITSEHVLNVVPVPLEVMRGYPRGARTFDWLADGQAWLLFGHTLVDVESGKALGSLGVEGVRSQRVVDKDTLLLTVGDGPQARYLLVKLNMQALSEARGQLRGKPAAAPAKP